MTVQAEALKVLEEGLRELESPKGSVLSAIQKLLRVSGILENQDIQLWCSIQLGERRLVEPLERLLAALTAEDYPNSAQSKKLVNDINGELGTLNLKESIHYPNEELNIKFTESGGGYISIGFIEERYADLVRLKKGNDGTFYKNNLNNHLNFVRTKAHEFASVLHKKLKFSNTTSSCFDLLKQAADDRLLDLNPLLGEQLMLAFKAIASPNSEEWSQALTTCRRLLEGLADELHPPGTQTVKGRILTQTQYVNRLWAFMDRAIESDSNKDLAKAHIDFLGSWMERANKITNKGVHSTVTRLEAVKAVFHTYLVVADILEYLDASPSQLKSKPNLNTVTLDEIEALLDINRATAKEIVKARVQAGGLDKVSLSKVRGVGPKTLEKAMTIFTLK